ncbi:efflux RND transporter periplasmic adaptor subunit [Patescibacteria group bacterium]|nr:efflux RND transporter periplasmic adaptor subunit [Patescibacteria group bacterium]
MNEDLEQEQPKKKRNFFRRIKKRYIWGGLILLLIAVIVWRVIGGKSKPQYSQTYIATNQDVARTVLATGTVTSQSDLNLSFKNSGVVARVNVSVGDTARRGQILAALNESDASAAINQAEAAVLSAKANYNKVLSGASGAQIQVDQAAVDAAQVALDNAKSTYDLTVKQQQTLVANALSALLNTGLSASPATTNISTVTVSVSGTYSGTQQGAYTIQLGVSGGGYTYHVSGLETYDGIVTRGVAIPLGSKGLFITISSTGTINGNDTWTISVPNMQATGYVAAYNAYQAAIQTQNQSVSSAKGAVDAAQAALSQAQAQLNLETTPARQEDVDTALAQVKTAEAQLQSAQSQYNNNLIVAPIDGTITAVNIKLGETASSAQSAISMLDPNSLHVESDISESSITEVQVGQNIDMTLDAFGPDQHFSGQVLSIDPASTVISGVIDYRVVSSIADNPQIKPGMTVNLVIIIQKKTNVLAVPNRLIRTSGGKSTVNILRNGQVQTVEISTGLVGDTYTEITSGLNAGDEVVGSSSANG